MSSKSKSTAQPAHPSTEDQDHHDQDHPHVCNSGWVTISQLVVNDDGEEVEEHALYLCRRCAEEARA